MFEYSLYTKEIDSFFANFHMNEEIVITVLCALCLADVCSSPVGWWLSVRALQLQCDPDSSWLGLHASQTTHSLSRGPHCYQGNPLHHGVIQNSQTLNYK